MKRAAWWLTGLAALPVILFLLLTLLLYCPPIQRWAVGEATQLASESTGMDVSIRDVSLRFPLDLQLGGVQVLQRNDSLPQRKDTLLRAETVVCKVELCPLFSSQVNVDVLQLGGVKLNTTSMISDCRVRGTVGMLTVTSRGINLKGDSVMLDRAMLSRANLDICLSDTAQKDTTTSETPWVIQFRRLQLNNSKVLLHLPGDTLNVGAGIGTFTARNGTIDLRNSIYHLNTADIRGSQLRYDDRFQPRASGLDFNHIHLTELNIGLDSFHYAEPDINFIVRRSRIVEKSGLTLSALYGRIHVDSTSFHVQEMALKTPVSSIWGKVYMDFNAFDEVNPGRFDADVDATIGKRDLMLLTNGAIPTEVSRLLPEKALEIKGMLRGNLQHCDLRNATISVPSLINSTITGTVNNISNPDYLVANLKMQANAADGNGSIGGRLMFRMQGMAYDADLDIRRFNINRFMPGYGLGSFTGKVSASGRGTDVFSPSMMLTAKASIGSFRYDKYDLSGSDLVCRIANGRVHANVNTASSILKTTLTVDALMDRRKFRGTVSADLHNIDLYALRMVEKPFKIAACLHLDIDTDMKLNHRVQGGVGDIHLTDSARTFSPDDINIDLFTRRDSTHADIDCGDFCLQADAAASYVKLMDVGNKLSREVDRQIKNREINELALRGLLPNGHFYLKTGMENPLMRFVRIQGYSLANMYVNADTSPVDGLNGDLHIDTLRTEGMQLDDISLSFSTDEQEVNYVLNVHNDKRNPTFAFTANAEGVFRHSEATAMLNVDDVNGRRMFDLDLAARMEPEGIRVFINESKQVIAYHDFAVNKDNYIMLRRDMRIAANLRLQAADGMGVLVYTDDDNADALQDVTLSLHDFDLASLSEAVPFLPKVTGKLDGDFHAVMTSDNITISTDMGVHQLTYEGSPVGNLSTELAYMPLGDDRHSVSGTVYKDGTQIADINGTYTAVGAGSIDADVQLTDMPLNIINGFIPNQLIGFEGTATGGMTITGNVAEPMVDGSVRLKDGRLISVPYGVSLAMSDKKVNIVASVITFEDFGFYDKTNRPIMATGYCDFSSLENILLNLSIKGDNILIIDAKETRKSEAYGKAYVNFYGAIQGELSNLNVKAQLDVLPSTNLYYILRDSPLAADNRLHELVTFTDFNSPEELKVELPKPSGMNMDLKLSVRDGSHIKCWLNPNHSNYLDIVGGGNLRMQYRNGDIDMTGRYTISEGEMKFSLPVIPLSTFTISSDSYIEFNGDVMDPLLHITATERTRATVNGDDGNASTVDFDCGVRLSNTLSNMGLEFIIDAPNNNSMQEKFRIMSLEERGKIAVTMLTTGMYIDESNTSNITMSSALSSFLQSEINAIAGSALKSLDLTMGVENTLTDGGVIEMDYTFKFSKRLFNNRLSVSVGGRIPTGSKTSRSNNTFFDLGEVQYRLSDTSNQYLRAFFRHNVHDYLEGDRDHFGAGYTWRRKFGYDWLRPKKRSLSPALPHREGVNNEK